MVSAVRSFWENEEKEKEKQTNLKSPPPFGRGLIKKLTLAVPNTVIKWSIHIKGRSFKTIRHGFEATIRKAKALAMPKPDAKARHGASRKIKNCFWTHSPIFFLKQFSNFLSQFLPSSPNQTINGSLLTLSDISGEYQGNQLGLKQLLVKKLCKI